MEVLVGAYPFIWKCFLHRETSYRTFIFVQLVGMMEMIPSLRSVDCGHGRQVSPGCFSSFITNIHQGSWVTHNTFHSFLPLCSGTAQWRQPVDSGLPSTAGWHWRLKSDLTVVDRQNCFQCTPKEALSKANIDFGGVIFFFSICFLPGASK